MSSEIREQAEGAIRAAEREHESILQRGRIRYVAKISPDGDGVLFKPLPLDGVERADSAPVDANVAFAVGQAMGSFGYRLHLVESAVMPDILELLQRGGHIPFSLNPVLPERGSEGKPPPGATGERQRSSDGCLVIVCGPDGCYGYCDFCP